MARPQKHSYDITKLSELESDNSDRRGLTQKGAAKELGVPYHSMRKFVLTHYDRIVRYIPKSK